MIGWQNINISEKVKITIALCVSALILVALGIYANSKTIRYKESMRDVNLSGIIITQSQDVSNGVRDIQSLYRGYIITNDSTLVESYEISSRLLSRRVTSLKNLPMTYPQRLLLDTISTLLADQRSIAEQIITRRKSASFLDAWNYLNNGDEATVIHKLQYYISRFINEEKSIQAQKLKTENENFDKVIYLVTICVTTAVIIILLTLFYIRKIYERLTKAERLLIKSQLRLESILDKLPIGVIIVNSNNNEYHANHKAVQLLDKLLLPDGHLFDEPNARIVHESTGTYTFSGSLNKVLREKLLISNAIHGEENIGQNETLINIDGRQVPFRVSAIPLYNERGRLEYAISVFDDISNLKQVENELIEAKKIVEESLRLKESFLSNMSHEIRTPINSILGFAELLSKKDLGVQENEYVRIIGSAGENLLRLLNDILDFSKLESNMMVFEEHPVTIDGILSSICNLFLPGARSKGITISYDCDEKIPDIVTGDPVRLTQVLTNIVGNAIKFTPKGSILINAKLLESDDQQTVVKFDVKDSGIGISKDKLPRVFKRFEQAAVDTTRFYGGTGLGLSIAKHIVESQGGSISVSSELGVGSVFTFILPFKNFNTEVELEKQQENREVLDLSFLNKLSILLVEDNQLNIKLIQGILAPVEIDVAETGNDAIKKLQLNRYDIVLMDIELPDMNGYATTRIIRNDMQLDLPIIALTAHVLAGEKERCLKAGMNDYLTKPVNTRQLFEKMKVLVQKKEGPEEEADNGKLVVKAPDLVSPGNDLFAQTNLIDLSYLHELSDNNKEFEKEIIELFLEQIPSQTEELERSFREKDYTGLKMIAHKLKSSTAVTLGRHLIPHFELLEDNAQRGLLSESAESSFKMIHGALKEAVVQLNHLLAEQYQEA
ncbi:hypothetical protein GCM10027051_14570 [Niabella terrae]